MTREAAQELVRWYSRAQGAVLSPGLNPQGFGGIAVGGAQLYFEYHEDTKSLECSALVYRFREPPKPGVLEGFEAEAREGTDTGGGTVDYERENRGLFLSRVYTQMPDGKAFAQDMKRLGKASVVWGDEVLDRVASRVFHPEELQKH
ncbi:hypothetical protein F0U60_51695 [Archangium minus]|uniref:Lipoprotein n=1 Tax=Archangium minus TaxID=83450 RepID=A0ABY9XCJ0_9BACT|nr:hypothetical protein F0U61_51445 [Archangium violaceum]WNG53058.1 hypothetical protein F0U60_51695 [Archangium minus]